MSGKKAIVYGLVCLIVLAAATVFLLVRGGTKDEILVLCGGSMRAALEAVRGCGSERVMIATPTGSLRAAQALAPEVEDLFCANVRGGWRFAVAEAYEEWTDEDEAQAAAILARAREPA